ncbi:MAG: sensor histidine kinase [Nitrospirae bacterium]|nr:sensor histidine kinase [Nitrospirota bacterium]MDA1303111.1 sensor histidine kinase [Nitrospirota bacterium]
MANSMNFSSSKISLLCGVVLMILGGFVLFAWGTNNIALIQIRPSLVPMPITGAVGFLLSGLGLIFLNILRVKEAKVVGVLTGLLGGLAFVAFVVPWELLGNPFRLSLNSALSFLLVGMGILAVTNNELSAKGTLISGVLGAFIFALGAVALFAHLIDLDSTQGWGQIIRMAVHEPGGFGILAIGLIAFSWQNEKQKVIGSPPWLPVLVGVGGMTISLGLWIHLDIPKQSIVAMAVLMFGLLMASLLSVAVYFMQRERRLLVKLHLSHQGLEKEITERKQVEEHLRVSRGELRDLSHRLQSIREEEKSNIAREVHDELGQVLTALKMDLSCLDEDSRDSNTFHKKIQSMSDLLDQTVETVQRICLELRPKVLDVFGLAEAIEWQTKEFQDRTGIQCDLVMEQEKGELDSERSLTCFRVLQEALTNVARHAKATHVDVRFFQGNGHVLLEVNDNGEGIENHKIFNSHSLGLLGIRERVLPLGGEVSIKGMVGEGTQVSIKIPYPLS